MGSTTLTIPKPICMSITCPAICTAAKTSWATNPMANPTITSPTRYRVKGPNLAGIAGVFTCRPVNRTRVTTTVINALAWRGIALLLNMGPIKKIPPTLAMINKKTSVFEAIWPIKSTKMPYFPIHFMKLFRLINKLDM